MANGLMVVAAFVTATLDMNIALTLTKAYCSSAFAKLFGLLEEKHASQDSTVGLIGDKVQLLHVNIAGFVNLYAFQCHSP